MRAFRPHSAVRVPQALLACGIGLLVLVAGCRREEDEVRSYDAPKDPQLNASAARPKVATTITPQMNQPRWTLPAGWSQQPGGAGTMGGVTQARFATIYPEAGKTDLELPVMELPLQEIESNYVRWAGNVGVPSPVPADANKYVTTFNVQDATAHLFDITGPAGEQGAKRIVAALVNHERSSWSFRLIGPADRVAAHRAGFEALIRSVRFHEDGGGTVTQPAGTVTQPAAAAKLGFTYALPAGWTKVPTESAMRLATFTTDAAGAELAVSQLASHGFGSWEENIRNWATSVGAPVPSVNGQNLPKVKFNGTEAIFLDFPGPAKRQMLAIFPRGGTTFFFKLTGDAAAVASARAGFEKFLNSLAFEE